MRSLVSSTTQPPRCNVRHRLIEPIAVKLTSGVITIGNATNLARLVSYLGRFSALRSARMKIVTKELDGPLFPQETVH